MNYVPQVASLAWNGAAQIFRAPTHSRCADACRRLARHWLWVVMIGGGAIIALAGALVGIMGAMFVRYWFASHHLLFTIGSTGAIHPLPEPAFRHLKGVAREPAAS